MYQSSKYNFVRKFFALREYCNILAKDGSTEHDMNSSVLLLFFFYFLFFFFFNFIFKLVLLLFDPGHGHVPKMGFHLSK